MCEGTDSRCTTTVAVRGTRLAGASSRFLLPTFLCGRQRKVGAAPHRGNANKPISNQGKANTVGIQAESAAQANKPGNAQRRRQTRPKQPPRRPNPKQNALIYPPGEATPKRQR